jgi:hypothetical protein
MHIEAIPNIERFEFDPAIWTEPSQNDQKRSQSDVAWLINRLGRTAVASTIDADIGSAIYPLYLRGHYNLSSEDVRQLEEYIDFLRNHYGIPEGVSVFPKKETMPLLEAPSEDHDEA